MMKGQRVHGLENTRKYRYKTMPMETNPHVVVVEVY